MFIPPLRKLLNQAGTAARSCSPLLSARFRPVHDLLCFPAQAAFDFRQPYRFREVRLAGNPSGQMVWRDAKIGRSLLGIPKHPVCGDRRAFQDGNERVEFFGIAVSVILPPLPFQVKGQ